MFHRAHEYSDLGPKDTPAARPESTWTTFDFVTVFDIFVFVSSSIECTLPQGLTIGDTHEYNDF